MSIYPDWLMLSGGSLDLRKPVGINLTGLSLIPGRLSSVNFDIKTNSLNLPSSITDLYFNQIPIQEIQNISSLTFLINNISNIKVQDISSISFPSSQPQLSVEQISQLTYG